MLRSSALMRLFASPWTSQRRCRNRHPQGSLSSAHGHGLRARLAIELLEDRTVPTITAVHDVYLVPPNAAYPGASVLANDVNSENSTMYAMACSPMASHGTTTVYPDGTFVYTPDAGFTGLDQFAYSAWGAGAPNDPTARSTAYLVVADVPPWVPGGPNRPPIVVQLGIQNDIEGWTVSVDVVAIDPESDNIGYTAVGLPDGLTINHNTGTISGKISYEALRTNNVSVTVADDRGASAGMNFVWNVADATIGTLKGTELHDGAAVPNSVTVSAIFNTTLYLSPGNTIRLEVAPPPDGNLPLWADILFWSPGATPTSGDFSGTGWPNLSFSSASGSYYVYVGIDLNGNGTLENEEMTQGFDVRVISFAGAEVGSQRVGGGPVEPGLTEIKEYEHFEFDGTFKFQIMGGIAGSNSMIRWQIVRVASGLPSVYATGSGNSFNYQFPEALTGWKYRVEFYADANNDSDPDDTETSFASPWFYLRWTRYFYIDVDVSDAIPNAAAFADLLAMQARFDEAANLLLRKDSESDWRAAVGFTVRTSNTFEHTPSGGDRPDPVANDIDERAKHFNADADVVFVNDLVGAAGLTWHHSWYEIIIGYKQNANGNEVSLAKTIAHEMGHGVGLDHIDPEDADRVMTELWTGTQDHLTRAEARAYDSGQLYLEESPQQAPAASALSEGELAAIFDDARARLLGAGNAAFDFSQIELMIVDLPGSLLGLTSENTIWIDQNAAGHGWFIDATPREDSEFRRALDEHELQAVPGSPAFGKADLLTVLFHEMGHVMGLEHGLDHEVMAPTLPLGIRRLPEPEFISSESIVAETSPEWLHFAAPKNLLRDSDGVAIPVSIMPPFFASPAPVSTVWQPTLLHEKTPVLVPAYLRDVVFEEMWPRHPYLSPSKASDLMDDFWSIPGVFDSSEGFPWNA